MTTAAAAAEKVSWKNVNEQQQSSFEHAVDKKRRKYNQRIACYKNPNKNNT